MASGCTEDLKDMLEEKIKAVLSFLMKGNVEEALKYYSDDCVYCAPGQAEAKGKKGLLEHLKAESDSLQQVKRVSVSVEQLYDQGDVAVTRFNVEGYGLDDSLLPTSRAIFVWKKIDGDYFVDNGVSNRLK
ncbi:uncharacterized protein LOC124437209 [Xenia sp. Carnegie-2017]|uniref:uncharacterized protein LOC124437209 n=1 Tax=Xenia sp. Carnegie-2017 TaxID=2897299 RepID=UPI001F03B925|nr:uncharacterized protein LOC124437209 [Xenia sp. Carnegie-2017]